MGLVGVVDGPFDGMKLITKGLEGSGILRDRSGAAFHQLEIILETNFTSFGSMAEGILEGKPYFTCGGQTYYLSHGFLCKGREEEA